MKTRQRTAHTKKILQTMEYTADHSIHKKYCKEWKTKKILLAMENVAEKSTHQKDSAVKRKHSRQQHTPTIYSRQWKKMQTTAHTKRTLQSKDYRVGNSIHQQYMADNGTAYGTTIYGRQWQQHTQYMADNGNNNIWPTMATAYTNNIWPTMEENADNSTHQKDSAVKERQNRQQHTSTINVRQWKKMQTTAHTKKNSTVKERQNRHQHTPTLYGRQWKKMPTTAHTKRTLKSKKGKTDNSIHRQYMADNGRKFIQQHTLKRTLQSKKDKSDNNTHQIDIKDNGKYSVLQHRLKRYCRESNTQQATENKIILLTMEDTSDNITHQKRHCSQWKTQ